MTAQLGKSLGLAGANAVASLELEEVKTLLRHENFVTTFDVYGHMGLAAKATNPTTEGRVRQAVWQIFPKPMKRMAPQVGLEPTTLRLTAGCSAIELLRSVFGSAPEGRDPFLLLLS
jgi:hypothetical protein